MMLMIQMTRFEFDCPSCGLRTRISADERGLLKRCDSCGVNYPAPLFRTSLFEARPTPRQIAQTCYCPRCQHRIEACNGGDAELIDCDACGVKFQRPQPVWERWRRPVARVFSREDCRRSLHHLMLSADRRMIGADAFDVRGRRRFEFYCGTCGHLHTARVCEIASQRRCEFCDELMIIPAPTRGGADAKHKLYHARRPRRSATAGLFCPRCGRAIIGADRSRRRKSRCDACRIWF